MKRTDNGEVKSANGHVLAPFQHDHHAKHEGAMGVSAG